MILRTFTRLLYLLATMTVCTTLLHANKLNGSMPVVGVSFTENGPNLRAATTVMGTNWLTSGAGSGDFSIVGLPTSVGPLSLTDPTVSTGGGFSISNADYGSLVATGGSIMAETANVASFTLVTTGTPIPERATMVIMGIGLCGAALLLRHKLRHG